MPELVGNLLVGQSGGPTSVINASLAGVIQEAGRHECIEEIFGGANGFNIFRPEQLGLNKNIPPVVFTDFQLFNKSLKAEDLVDGKVLLPQSITEISSLVLPPGKNVFSIEFAALNFFHPENNAYKYRLEGFDEDWLTADSKSRRVTFTNLDPGTYTFRVKASNNDGAWNEKGASLEITVLPSQSGDDEED